MAKWESNMWASNNNHSTVSVFDFQCPDEFKGWGLFDAMLFTLLESRRTPDPVLPRDRSRFTTASPLASWL